MSTIQAVRAREPAGPGVLAIAFATTVAMWTVGYVSRLPVVLAPSPLLFALLLVCLFAGGLALGRYAGLAFRHGAVAGLITGTLNLLVLGGLLAHPERPDRLVPSALVWLPASILLGSCLAGAGAGVGARWLRRPTPCGDWTAVFVHVAIVASLLLLAVGGLVTSTGAGLAVVDWPNSFGHNMFLYPLSRMTGGIYYEHAHRLFGALVGLTTLVLALVLERSEPRAWVRRFAWFAVLVVVVQGILGGLRVTGRFTTSVTPEDMRPSVALAMIHGILGQAFFASLVALGAFTSRRWKGPTAPLERPSALVDRALGAALVALLLCQLSLGAAQRHLSALLMAHVLVAVAVVAPLGLHAGFRAWGLNPGSPLLRRLGLGLVSALAAQVFLGFGAWAAQSAVGAGQAPPVLEVTVTTAHQWFGAILLALATLLACWNFRLLSAPERRDYVLEAGEEKR